VLMVVCWLVDTRMLSPRGTAIKRSAPALSNHETRNLPAMALLLYTTALNLRTGV
jgi:hypothetical protein